MLELEDCYQCYFKIKDYIVCKWLNGNILIIWNETRKTATKIKMTDVIQIYEMNGIIVCIFENSTIWLIALNGYDMSRYENMFREMDTINEWNIYEGRYPYLYLYHDDVQIYLYYEMVFSVMVKDRWGNEIENVLLYEEKDFKLMISVMNRKEIRVCDNMNSIQYWNLCKRIKRTLIDGQVLVHILEYGGKWITYNCREKKVEKSIVAPYIKNIDDKYYMYKNYERKLLDKEMKCMDVLCGKNKIMIWTGKEWNIYGEYDSKMIRLLKSKYKRIMLMIMMCMKENGYEKYCPKIILKENIFRYLFEE